VDQSEMQQRRIDQAFLAQKRNPGNHPDDVGGQERHGADQEQPDRQQRIAHVEHQEIGHEEAEQLMKSLSKASPKLVEELIPKVLPLATERKIKILIETVGTEVVGRERRADFCSRRPGCLAGVRGFELVNVWPII